ncbi:hypothetical protein RFI_06363 [Reticulomyxa filosa]|uniref:GOST seven transmembrane domain-containing protein n=1 Tax=Reticulomyxa filosa TaxID=46433 RepID=X6NWQ9_RETFI|nr:hypothetical protein RFI_06363 [Reticulomyxa filosa]|eukprot:ETO30755.1 hypothetical protein RFI_06363 [Reticulomyxa filosa]
MRMCYSNVKCVCEDKGLKKGCFKKKEKRQTTRLKKKKVNVHREEYAIASSIELIVIPDSNMGDIGVEFKNELHICCNLQMVTAKKCDQEDLDRLILKKDVPGLYRYEIAFEKGEKDTNEIQVTGIHVFAMASCRNGLGVVRFEGESVWMNPYGHLPGDVYGYLPFFGWMTVTYLLVALFWFCLNAIFWKELLHVQVAFFFPLPFFFFLKKKKVDRVMVMCLIEMATWYFDYLQLNNVGSRQQGPFVLGLVFTVTRRMVSSMLVVAVSLGFGVVKPALGPEKNKLIALGCLYWVFAFMFEALIHYNQTEKVETWMRAILIPPVAILNGIFWWWTFISLKATIDMLKTRKQSAKLQLYKSFTLVLLAALLAAIGFAIYEMYYMLRELYFQQWDRLCKAYAFASQIGQDEDADEDADDDDDVQLGKPDTLNEEDDDHDHGHGHDAGNRHRKHPEFGGAAPTLTHPSKHTRQNKNLIDLKKNTFVFFFNNQMFLLRFCNNTFFFSLKKNIKIF